MPLVETVIADGAKICELARDQHGTVTAFARSIGKRPEAIWNMQQQRCRIVSVKNITAIAEALGVPVGEITLADENADEAETEAEPNGAAA
jgi:cytochrome oxidase assembly protein ShyY1